jgi:hypothetical protein
MRQNRTRSLNRPAFPKKTEGRKVRVRDVSSKANCDRRTQRRPFPERKQGRAEQRVRRCKRNAYRERGRRSGSEATSAGRATQLDPSLLGGLTGRLRHSWFIRGWSARRTVHQDGEGRVDGFRAHRFFRDRSVAGAAVWRSVAGPVRQIQPHDLSQADGQAIQ